MHPRCLPRLIRCAYVYMLLRKACGDGLKSVNRNDARCNRGQNESHPHPCFCCISFISTIKNIQYPFQFFYHMRAHIPELVLRHRHVCLLLLLSALSLLLLVVPVLSRRPSSLEAGLPVLFLFYLFCSCFVFGAPLCVLPL